MTLRHIIHINLRVPSEKLETCRSFYCDILGLKAGPRPPFASVGYWLYAQGAPVVHLVAESTATSVTRHGHPAMDHVAFDCTDLSATLDLLQARKIPYRLSTVPTLDRLQVNFNDPVGVGIELSFAGERPETRTGGMACTQQ